MNKLEAMKAFCLVAENQSFASAAREMNLSPTMISRYVKQLEQELGCLLLKRNTRTVYLTQAGSQYRESIKPILKKLSLVEHQVSLQGKDISGSLTLSASLEFGGQYLAPIIDQFSTQNGKVDLKINLTNKPVDLYDSEYDLAFRVAPKLANASYIAMPVCHSRLALWASPEYLSENGLPDSIESLEQHRLLFFSHSIRKDHWIFCEDEETYAVKLPWAWRSDNGRLLNEAAALGHGIIQAPSYSVASFVERDELVEVLPQYSFNKLIISAVYPHRFELSSKIKALVDITKRHFELFPLP